jgi:superfamily II RNA helicase
VFARIGVPPQKPFTPDPFQVKALEAIERSDCLVTAPTGSGKTWIAVQAISKALDAGRRSWYATPLKALSNAKYEEFKGLFGEDLVGILTGDRKENPDAAVIVGTTEILRNQLYDVMGSGSTLNTDLVVLDEAHFLGDEERGVVWEEVMIYLPARIPLLMLSATVGNADQIARWLASIRGQACTVVEDHHRPVPLFPLFLHPSGLLLPLMARTGNRGRTHVHKKVAAALKARHAPRLGPSHRLPPFGDILRVLKKFHLLPAIFFLKSRADCNQALEMCRSNRIVDPERARRLQERTAELMAAAGPAVSRHSQLRHLVSLGVASHHSGQLPAWKQVVETLMSEGLLDAVFATSTVAAGVNFPARTVVLVNSDRFNGTEFLPLTASEFHQMTGRAGRRGMDRIGFVLTVPGKFMDIWQIARLITAPPSDVHSRIRINFPMTLNLLLSHTPEQVDDLLVHSFANFLLKQKNRRRRGSRQSLKDLRSDFQRHLSFLKEKGYVDENDRLSADGVWAARLRIDQPLLIAEGLRMGLFSRLAPAGLAGIMAAFVNERETDEHLEVDVIAGDLVRDHVRFRKTLTPLVGQMRRRGFEVRPFNLKPAAVLHAWASGQPWEKLTAWAQMADGDLAMLILRTADHLKHLRSLRREFPGVAAAAVSALEQILREPVDPGYYAAGDQLEEGSVDEQGLAGIDL